MTMWKDSTVHARLEGTSLELQVVPGPNPVPGVPSKHWVCRFRRKTEQFTANNWGDAKIYAMMWGLTIAEVDEEKALFAEGPGCTCLIGLVEMDDGCPVHDPLGESTLWQDANEMLGCLCPDGLCPAHGDRSTA